MAKKIKQIWKSNRKLSRLIFFGILVFIFVSSASTFIAYANQNGFDGDHFGYGASSMGYVYGYGYWSEPYPTLTMTYGSCTSSCSVGSGNGMTITATFSSTPTGHPDISLDLPGTVNDVAYTAMTGTGAVWTYSYTAPSTASNQTATVAVRTMGGGGYTPVASTLTFTVNASAGGGSGSSGTSSPSDDSTSEDEPAEEVVVIVGDGETESIDLADSNQTTLATGATVTFSVAGGDHSLAVNSINLTLGTAVITVSSDPIDVDLAIGETSDVDVNGDGVDDLRLTLNDIISETQLDLTITGLNLDYTVEEETATGDEPTAESNVSSIPQRSGTPNLDNEKEGVKHFVALTGKTPTGNQWSVVHFIAYGTTESTKMSVRDRKGVVGDYYDIYGRVPVSNDDWSDIALILTSHKPHQRNVETEKQAIVDFIKVYKRLPNYSNVHDEWAMYYIAYNIRNIVRNIDAEKSAISTFKSVFRYVPSTSHHWSIMRAIAYSGASR